MARQAAAEPEVARARRDRSRARRVGARRRWRRSGAASTARCTPSASRRASCLGGGFMDTPWEDVVDRGADLDLLAQDARRRRGAADDRRRIDRRARLRRRRWPGRPTTGWAWPRPRSSRTARYLARDLGPQGIRVNLVAAGPVKTMAAKSIPGFAAVRGRVGAAGAARLGRASDSVGRGQGAAWRCCRTGSRRPRARSSTSTAATTPSAPDKAALSRMRRICAHTLTKPVAGVGDGELVVDRLGERRRAPRPSGRRGRRGGSRRRGRRRRGSRAAARRVGVGGGLVDADGELALDDLRGR